MQRRVLEFRPNSEANQPIINPFNNLVAALAYYIDSIVDERVNEKLERSLKEIQPVEEKQLKKSSPDKLISAKELGVIVGFAESTINDMAEQGKIPVAWRHEKGKKTFRRFDVEEVLEAMKVKQDSPKSGA